MLQLISVTYATFYTKLQMTLLIAYKNEPCSSTAGSKTWLLFSVMDMSWPFQGVSEPDLFYGGFVYKFKKIVGSYNFSAKFI